MLNNIKIGPKLIGGFLIVAVITAFIGIMGISNMGKMNNMLSTLYDKHLQGISFAKEANINLIYIGRAVRQMVLAKNQEEREVQMQNIDKFDVTLRANLDSTQKTIVNDDGKRAIENIQSNYNDYMSEVKKFEATIKGQEYLKINEAVVEGINITKEKADKADDAMTALAVLKIKYGKQLYDESDIIYSQMRTLLIVLVIIGTLIGFLVGFFLSRSITKPLSQAVDMIQEMEKGHLGKRLNMTSKDEIGIMASAMDKFAEDLQKNVVTSMQKISDGDVSMEIELKDNRDEINPALKKTIESIRALISETKMLAQEAINGNLAKRGKEDNFKGAYKDIIVGLNGTLDAILNPINEASTVLEKVAARDMTARVNGDYKGDHAKLKSAVNVTIDNLDGALLQVSQATEQVSSASQQISSGSQSLAQGANEQASSLEEVSSSLEEMASMTKQNADNAQQAKMLASEANDNAAIGKEAVNRMADAINKIKESSDKTAKIVKTIDEIAMQTNLLALNAAVEAARAGEAGRGFAVVAEEVRNLAQRSAQAAKNTADMIAESVKNSEEGVKITSEVASSFLAITESSGKVDTLISEIATASQEQSQGIDQVNSAVAQLDKIIQQNAANSEESASAAEELNSQAEELQNMVGQFELTHSDAGFSHTEKRLSSVQHPLPASHHNVLNSMQKKSEKKSKTTGESDKSRLAQKIVSKEDPVEFLQSGNELKEF